MCTTPSATEIKNSIFSIEADNSPGPDGFTTAFYISCWDVISKDVISAIQSFFGGEQLPRGWKSTFLALIPKKDKPTSFAECRPISLCNVCYKVVSTILANRLPLFLPKLISDEQGAFVKGRLIQENIGLTQEMIQHIDHGKEGGNVVLNIDMEKAFDRRSWKFLLAVLTKFGFSDNCLKLIQHCVENNCFSVMSDGSSIEFFMGTRGLR